GAGVVIRYVKHLVVENCGSYGHGISNSLSIYNCDKVDVIGSTDRGYGESGFGVFVYNSDNVTVQNVSGRDITEEYVVQLKDCRNSSIVNCRGDGGYVGFNIKCSGMNP